VNQRDEIKIFFFVSLLGATDVGTKVYISRVRQYSPTDFPVISIYTPKEVSERESRNPDQYGLTTTIQLDIITNLTENFEQALDTITEQIEDTILALDPRSGITGGNDLWYVETEVSLYGDEARQEMAVASMRFNFNYSALAPQPTEDDLLTVETINETGAIYS